MSNILTIRSNSHGQHWKTIQTRVSHTIKCEYWSQVSWECGRQTFLSIFSRFNAVDLWRPQLPFFAFVYSKIHENWTKMKPAANKPVPKRKIMTTTLDEDFKRFVFLGVLKDMKVFKWRISLFCWVYRLLVVSNNFGNVGSKCV